MTATNLTLPSFRDMDAGVPVCAAAAGTVIAVQDGNFDRQTTMNSDNANFVTIDLGNGWTTDYYHFAANTITVSLGQTVAAGEVLGLAGSSGSSTDAHLHFALKRKLLAVETFFDPNTYWVSPLPYQGDTAPAVLAHGVTNLTRLG